MTHPTITHLLVHMSCLSVHHWSIPSCYHLPLPGFPNSSPPAFPPFVHPDLNPSIDPHTQTYIYPLRIYLSNRPFFLPSLLFSFLPRLLIPVERFLQQDLTRSTTSAVPARERTHSHAKSLPTGRRRKDTQTSFSQLPEQLKWPGRVCAEQRRRIKERVSVRESLRYEERKITRHQEQQLYWEREKKLVATDKKP